jgi:hypothetical protein
MSLYRLLASIATLLLALTFAASAQTTHNTTAADIDTLLPSGTFTAALMDVVISSPHRRAMMKRAQEAMRANPEWWSRRPSQGQRPYSAESGLTEAEYKELQRLLDDRSDMRQVASGTVPIEISREDGRIRFRANGRLAMLNEIEIDERAQLARYGAHELPLADTFAVTTAKNTLQSRWRGYVWSYYKENSDIVPRTAEELAAHSVVYYSITIGVLESTGETYIEVEGHEGVGGKPKVDNAMQFVIRTKAHGDTAASVTTNK